MVMISPPMPTKPNPQVAGECNCEEVTVAVSLVTKTISQILYIYQKMSMQHMMPLKTGTQPI